MPVPSRTLKAGLSNGNVERSLPYWALNPAVLPDVTRISRPGLWRAAGQTFVTEPAPPNMSVDVRGTAFVICDRKGTIDCMSVVGLGL